MIGIVGVRMKPRELREVLKKYIEDYYAAMDRALDEAGGEMQVSVMGEDPWVPALPDSLRPSWVHTSRATHDGPTFYIDLDGPSVNDVFVSQAISVNLVWENSFNPSFEIASVEVDPLCIRMFDETLDDLQRARELTSGLISAGRLMASLLEAPRRNDA